jgi:hypothetical protein
MRSQEIDSIPVLCLDDELYAVPFHRSDGRWFAFAIDPYAGTEGVWYDYTLVRRFSVRQRRVLGPLDDPVPPEDVLLVMLFGSAPSPARYGYGA